MKQKCRVTGQEFELRDKDLKFYERMGVPIPDMCPDEMLRNLMAFRNEWKLYRRKCDGTGETIISAYHSESPYKIYKNELWWGDSWDGTDFGKEFDFDRSFFEQFKELQLSVPREGTSVFNSENCDYNSHVRESKNCYLCSRTYRVEDCYHASWLVSDKNVVDCWRMIDCELCYECINCSNCFDCVMTQESEGCNTCYFSYQLQGCDHCIGCSNLRHKSYYVLNQKVTPEEFEKIKKEILNGTQEGFQKGIHYFQTMWGKACHRFVHNLNGENVVGDLLKNCKNCWHSFDGVESEDCAYNVSADQAKDIQHCFSTGWPGCELCYNSAVIRGSTDIRFSYYIWFSNDLTYCDSCVSCQSCFACVGLKHKKYCIFNKEYSQEEYLALRDKIIEHMKQCKEWGTFPSTLSTFCYNESAAENYYPLSEAEAGEMGFTWKIETEQVKRGEALEEIPTSLENVSESIIGKALVCKKTGKQFSIQKGELEFYKKMNVPLPTICPEERIEGRRQRRNKYILFSRSCDQCGEGIQSTFAPNRHEKVFCEKCYLASVD